MFRSKQVEKSLLRSCFRRYTDFQKDVSSLGGLNAAQYYQQGLYCQSLLGSCRHKVPQPENNEMLYPAELLPKLPEDFPILNVSAVRNAKDVYDKHLGDALGVVKSQDVLLAGVANPLIVDVGSGGGLPGLVIAIARPHWRVIVLDNRLKKVEFMRRAADWVGLTNVMSICGNAATVSEGEPVSVLSSASLNRNDETGVKKMKEYIQSHSSLFTLDTESKYIPVRIANTGAKQQLSGKADIVVSRGVTVLESLIPLTAGFVKKNGYAVYLKSAQLTSILDETQQQAHVQPEVDNVFHKERRSAIQHAKNPQFLQAAEKVLARGPNAIAEPSDVYNILSHEIVPVRSYLQREGFDVLKFVNYTQPEDTNVLPSMLKFLVIAQKVK